MAEKKTKSLTLPRLYKVTMKGPVHMPVSIQAPFCHVDNRGALLFTNTKSLSSTNGVLDVICAFAPGSWLSVQMTAQ